MNLASRSSSYVWSTTPCARVALVRGVAGLLVAASLRAGAAGAGTAELDLDALMRELLRPAGAFRDQALREIVRRGERAAIPGLVDLLFLDVFLDSSVADALQHLSGQTFGHGWRDWMEWLPPRSRG